MLLMHYFLFVYVPSYYIFLCFHFTFLCLFSMLRCVSTPPMLCVNKGGDFISECHTVELYTTVTQTAPAGITKS